MSTVERRRGDPRVAVGLVTGGALVVAGALLPWLTLFAGLQRYRGTTGLYGWLVLVGGAAEVLAGFWLWRSDRPWLRWAGDCLGLALCGFAVWLLAGLHEMVTRRAGPMLVPRAGPGLFVVLVGAGLLAGMAALRSLHAVRSGAPSRNRQCGEAAGQRWPP